MASLKAFLLEQLFYFIKVFLHKDFLPAMSFFKLIVKGSIKRLNYCKAIGPADLAGFKNFIIGKGITIAFFLLLGKSNSAFDLCLL